MPATAEYSPLFERKAVRRCTVLFFILFVLVVLIIIVVVVPVSLRKDDSGPVVAPLVVDGHWGDWRAWSQCSAPCDGGTQHRQRRCNNPAPLNDGATCLGNSTEQRACASQPCPDCDRQCPPGGVLIECTVCQCNGSLIQGKITDETDGLPIQNMFVFANKRQVAPQAITDNRGHYEVRDLCLEDSELEILTRKDAYVDTQTPVPSASNDRVQVNLVVARLVRPVFVTHPSPFAGFIGDRLELTCSARGNPQPEAFEWYKDGRLLRETEMTKNGDNRSTRLIVESAHEEDSGSYQCRAIAEAGKTFSHSTKVIITDGDDTCDSQPLARVVGLPPTCHDEAGKDHVNVGICPPSSCSTRQSDATAGNYHCCGPIRNEQKVVTCANISYTVSRVVECGCRACAEPEPVVLRVRVMLQISASRQEPAQFAQVRLNDGRFTQTNSQGELEMNAPWDNDDILLEMIPNPWNIEFMQQIKLVHYGGAAPGDEIPVIITLQRAPEPVKVNGSETSVLELAGAGDLPTDLSLSLPPGSFLRSDGAAVDGVVDVYATLHDARDRTNLSAAPGDFTYVTEEGYVRQLQTNGVISLMAVQNGKPLNISSRATLRLNTEQLGITIDMNGQPDTLLWTLDTSTGRWIQAGSLRFEGVYSRRRTRQLGSEASGEVDLRGPVAYLNLDKPIYEGRTCQVKVKAYANEARTIPAKRLNLLVYTKAENGIGYIGSVQQSIGHQGWACLPIPCGFQHEIIAQSFLTSVTAHRSHHLPSGFSFHNINAGTGVSFQSPFIDTIMTGSGPVHRYSARTCEKPTGADYSFVFILGEIARVGALYPVEPLPGKSLSWYSTPPQVCMIRIETPGLVDIDVIAESRQGGANGPSYGTYVTGLNSFHDAEYRRTRHIACIQVRCPDDVKEEHNTTVPLETHVDINFLRGVYDDCKFSDFRLGTHTSVTNYDYDDSGPGQDDSRSIYVKSQTDRYVALAIKHSVPSTGFYVHEEQSERVAYSEAYYECLSSYWSLARYTCATSDEGASDYDDYDYGPPQ